jgi:3-phenylpropionate/cinnamic acid dioxygenase small subunit
MSDVDMVLLTRVKQFLYREGRFADQHDYDAWEAMWADDGVYWIPANGEGGDPETEMSILFDNRSRIALRVSQLNTGRRLAQSPLSRLARSVSNVEILDRQDDLIIVSANVLIFESHTRGDQIWSMRNEYRLREGGDGDLRIVRKKVVLTNNHKPLYSMAFLV